MKRIIYLIAQHDFRDEELFETKEVLEEAGFGGTIASEHSGLCRGRLGGEVHADLKFSDINTHDFDAAVFVGGPGAQELFFNRDCHEVAQDMYASGKIVAAICVAPRILAEADLLDGKTVTSFSTQQELIEAKGATWTGEAVEIDGRIITANGPEAALQFGEVISAALLHENDGEEGDDVAA